MDSLIKNSNSFSNLMFLTMAIVFLLLGIGILTGLILPHNTLLFGGMRLLIGSVLALYGLARGIMILSSNSPTSGDFSAVDFILSAVAIIFFLFGLGLITGMLFGSDRNITGVNRSIIGGAMMLYGIWQGIRLIKRLKSGSALNEEG